MLIKHKKVIAQLTGFSIHFYNSTTLVIKYNTKSGYSYVTGSIKLEFTSTQLVFKKISFYSIINNKISVIEKFTDLILQYDCTSYGQKNIIMANVIRILDVVEKQSKTFNFTVLPIKVKYKNNNKGLQHINRKKEVVYYPEFLMVGYGTNSSNISVSIPTKNLTDKTIKYLPARSEIEFI